MDKERNLNSKLANNLAYTKAMQNAIVYSSS